MPHPSTLPSALRARATAWSPSSVAPPGRRAQGHCACRHRAHRASTDAAARTPLCRRARRATRSRGRTYGSGACVHHARLLRTSRPCCISAYGHRSVLHAKNELAFAIWRGPSGKRPWGKAKDLMTEVVELLEEVLEEFEDVHVRDLSEKARRERIRLVNNWAAAYITDFNFVEFFRIRNDRMLPLYRALLGQAEQRIAEQRNHERTVDPSAG
eukprot:1633997-Prymnesium_polylepis.1